MEPEIVIVPLVGGPADGSAVVCVLGPDGRPPLTHWLIGAEGLADAPIYELEAADDATPGPPWRYCFRICLADPLACGSGSGHATAGD
jgi:hypothetical protein